MPIHYDTIEDVQMKTKTKQKNAPFILIVI